MWIRIPSFGCHSYALKDGPQTFQALKDKTTTWVNNDSPGEMLSGKTGEQTLVFDATDYLMFQATDGLVAIWVPLKEVSTGIGRQRKQKGRVAPMTGHQVVSGTLRSLRARLERARV